MAEVQVKESGGGDGKVRVKKKSGKPDMTPMVDLGFLLITFFIYTTTFSKPNIMGFATPKKDDKPPEEQEQVDIKVSNTITIILGEDDRVFWYQKPLKEVTVDDLHETDYSAEGIRAAILLKKSQALTPENWTVIIKPSDESTWKNTVDILDEMAITDSEKKAVVDLQKVEKEAYYTKIGKPVPTE
ncbi:biopolymer transporter ExbD [Marinilongibacter aquaticus]|uniref:ExbD/TolR family protein n=1 Tax=Marinilongibacter aquaticus TaxID=2975157 RepID=UPI0021BD1F8B|nr:biopolymer transporter ExbD [Marinilongibacter aquaticus]UBM60327.1 biopolymer transporter ExbD [Marinilongibacter aquaticus]